MGFLYPRTVSIFRSTKKTAAGPVGYGGVDRKAGLTTIAEDVACSIQDKGTGRGGGVGSPADTVPSQWAIYTELGALADGQVCDRDLALDDLGRWFQVVGDYTNSLGGKLRVDRLEA